MDLKIVFGKNLKYYRFQKNYTQEKLAEEVNISTNYLSQLENGMHSADFNIIEDLAYALDIVHHKLFIEVNRKELPRRVDMKR